jgi:hypothetical protein
MGTKKIRIGAMIHTILDREVSLVWTKILVHVSMSPPFHGGRGAD